MEGYFLIHRSLCESSFWLQQKFTYGQAWIDLIHLASYKDTVIWIRGIKVQIKRGQVGIPLTKLAERWHWTRKNSRTFIRVLQSGHQIEHQKTNITSIITIVNYEKYQVGYSKVAITGTKEGQKGDSKTGNLYKEVIKKNNNRPGIFVGKSDYEPTKEEARLILEQVEYEKSIGRVPRKT